jgi:hypothetical protein
VVTLPFDNPRIAEEFDRKLADKAGQTLESVGQLEAD